VVSIGRRAQCDNLCQKVVHLTSSSAA
jgi:hypothetical protein